MSMLSGTIAFFVGICAVLACPWPPSVALLPAVLGMLGLLSCFLPAGARRHCLQWSLCFVAGLLWVWWRAELILAQELPRELEGRTISVRGRVISLPERYPDRVRFAFHVLELIDPEGKRRASPGKVRLSWYGRTVPIHAAEHWQLRVRLKRPHSLANPGGFDYERWLFQHRLRAVGYVYNHPGNRRLRSAPGWSIERLRESLSSQARQLLAERPAAALLIGLGVGDRSAISPEQWRILRHTGTSHLLAISGLHIGLVAAAAAWLGRGLWRRLVYWLPRLPAQHFAILLALPAATAYAALAGFSLPTCRALIMLGVAALAYLRGHRLGSSGIFALALLGILLLDPLAPISPGFWLSFGAVAVIWLSLRARGKMEKWRSWWQVQFAISLIMLPLLLAWFRQYPLFSLLANLLAVPWVGLLVLPATLAGFALLPLAPGAAQWPLQGAALALDGLWFCLQQLTKLPGFFLQPPAVSGTALLLGFLGALLLLLPAPVLPRVLGLACLLPLFFSAPKLPQNDAVHLTLLDVGQGLAAVVRTRQHVLIYDTGEARRGRRSIAESVLIPYLRSHGLRRVHTLIISHGDNDHAGGLHEILDYAQVDRILVGESRPSWQLDHQPCLDGQAWNWDGVHFELLHPERDQPASGNNRSCVLKISAHGRSILLTGDIEKPAERELLARHRQRLQADVLLVPHHGSRTSSSVPFIEAVAPHYALLSVGYLNRFRLPKKDILERYARFGAKILSTAQEGMIEVRLNADGWQIERYRHRWRRIWHR